MLAFLPIIIHHPSERTTYSTSIGGKNLVQWSLAALEHLTDLKEIILMTNDPSIVKMISGFEMSRLTILSTQKVETYLAKLVSPPEFHYLQEVQLPGDTICLTINPTTPFISTNDIDNALKLLTSSDTVVSCTKSLSTIRDKSGQPIDAPYIENGLFYISCVKNILEAKSLVSGNVAIYEMPSYTVLDLKQPENWAAAELFYRKFNTPSGQKRQPIKLFLTDVDGVLTDAGMYYTESGDELKKFNTHDGKGLELLRKAGVKTGIITSENTEMVTRRAKKLKVDFLHQGKDRAGKLGIVKTICAQEGISLQEVAYIGDDVNCLELLSHAGVAACPANALPTIKGIPGILQLEKCGGDGAVRAFVEYLFAEGLVEHKA